METNTRHHGPVLIAFVCLIAACEVVDINQENEFEPDRPSSETVPATLSVLVTLEGDPDGQHLGDVRLSLAGTAHDGAALQNRSIEGTELGPDGRLVFDGLPATLESGRYALTVSHPSGAFVPVEHDVQLDFAERASIEVRLPRRRAAVVGRVVLSDSAASAAGLTVSLYVDNGDRADPCLPGSLIARADTRDDGDFILDAAGAGIPQPIDRDACLVVGADGHVTYAVSHPLKFTGARFVLADTITLERAMVSAKIFGRTSWTEPEVRQRRPLGDEFVSGRLVGLDIDTSGEATERQFGSATAGVELAIRETADGAPPPTLDFRPLDALFEVDERPYYGEIAPDRCVLSDGRNATLPAEWSSGALDEHAAAILPYCLRTSDVGAKRVWVALRNRYGHVVQTSIRVVLDDGAQHLFRVEMKNGNSVEGTLYTVDDALDLVVEPNRPILRLEDWCVAISVEPGFDGECPASLDDYEAQHGTAPACEAVPPNWRFRAPLSDVGFPPDGEYLACVYLRGPEGRSEVRTLRVERMTGAFEVYVEPTAPGGGWRATTCGLDTARVQTCQRFDGTRLNGPMRLRVRVQGREGYTMRVLDDPLRALDQPWHQFLDVPIVWSFSGADGPKSLRVEVGDRAGTIARSEELEFYLDTSPPRLPQVEVLLQGGAAACQDPLGANICERSPGECGQCGNAAHPCRPEFPRLVPPEFVVGGAPMLRPGLGVPVTTSVGAEELQIAGGGLCLQIENDDAEPWYEPICASAVFRLAVPDPGPGEADEPEVLNTPMRFRFSDRACNQGDETQLALKIDRRPPRLVPEGSGTQPSPCIIVAVRRGEDGALTDELVADMSETTADSSRCWTPAELEAAAPDGVVPVLRGVRLRLRDDGAAQLDGDIRYRLLLLDRDDAQIPGPGRDNERQLHEWAGFGDRLGNGSQTLPCPREFDILGTSRFVGGDDQNIAFSSRGPRIDPRLQCQGFSPDDPGRFQACSVGADDVPRRPACSAADVGERTSLYVRHDAASLLPHITGDSGVQPSADGCHAEGAPCDRGRDGFLWLIAEDPVGNRSLTRLSTRRVRFAYRCRDIENGRVDWACD